MLNISKKPNVKENTIQIIEYLHPVRCSCGMIFSVDKLNKYAEAKKKHGHLRAAMDAGFIRDCCLMNLVSPSQIPAVIKLDELEMNYDVFPNNDPKNKSKYPFHRLMIKATKKHVYDTLYGYHYEIYNYPTPKDYRLIPNLSISIIDRKEKYEQDYNFYDYPYIKETKITPIPQYSFTFPKRDLTNIVTIGEIRKL